MGLLLDAAYVAAGVVCSPWAAWKLATDPRWRHRAAERLGFVPRTPAREPVLWIHAASVGEVNLVRPLVRRLRERHPRLGLHVSTLTRAGRENAQGAFPEARVSYFPLDLSGAVRRALGRVAPRAVVLVELEVWPNFIAQCVRAGVPVGLVNGRITERSFRRYRRFRAIFGPAFRGLAAAGARDPEAAERLHVLGVPRVRVTGNLKYDAALDFDPERAETEWRGLLGLGDAPVLVAGSTHDPEERILVETYRRLQATYPRLRLVLAPRHLERVPAVQKTVEAAGFRCYKRSQLSPGDPADGVLLLDTVGELARVYSVATVVFIGGTFCARGGQNMLEPAALGKPVVSGPSLSNFEDVARALVEAGGMRVLDNPIELALAIGELVRDPERARAVGARARAAVAAGRGALAATVDLVETELLKGRLDDGQGR